MSPDIYPLQFKPILKERIWGGEKLKTILNKPIISDRTGESWEISTVPGDISVVRSGALAGKNINEVMYEVGYTDVKAFREVFRKITGMSPLAYKGKYNKEALA